MSVMVYKDIGSQLYPLNMRTVMFPNSQQGVWYDPSDFSTMFQDAAGTVPVTAVQQPVGRILDKSGNGNHATQATAASRPVLSARDNLSLKSEVFSDPVWVKVGGGVTLQGDGSFFMVEDTSSGFHSLNQPIAGFTAGLKTSSYWSIKAGTRTKVYIQLGANAVAVNLATGIAETIPAGYSCTAVSEGDGWWGFYTTANTPANNNNLLLMSNGSVSSYTGDGVSGFYVRRNHARIGNAIPRYQRVNTYTDYDTAGFPLFLRFDGVDDFLLTQSLLNLGTAATFAAGVRTNDVMAGNSSGIFQNRGTSSTLYPGYQFHFPNTVSIRLGDSTNGDQVDGLQLANGALTVAVAQYNAANIFTRANGAANKNAVRTTNPAQTNSAFKPGVGAFFNDAAPYHMINGNLYGLIAVNRFSTANETALLEKFLANKTGVTLP